MAKKSVHLWVNERELSLSVEPSRTLLDVLREDLNCVSVKEGCGRGDCGSCMVIMDEKPVNSCLVLIAQAADIHVLTLEGLSSGATLHPLQRKFVDKWAFQCGFCTPGMILSSYALLMKNLEPTEEDIEDAIVGNLCRCTDYHRVIEAVQEAARELRLLNNPL
jgi:aerobic carbon-monoxide dehydrogenase small subunit